MYKRFYNFDLSDEVLNALSEMGFEKPTPIQESAVPPAMEGLDIIGQAQTGTGKTAAFGIPIISYHQQTVVTGHLHSYTAISSHCCVVSQVLP